MVFTVLGAIAELERSLIAECVKAGLRNAKAKGTKLGRPNLTMDRLRIASLHAQGARYAQLPPSWAAALASCIELLRHSDDCRRAKVHR